MPKILGRPAYEFEPPSMHAMKSYQVHVYTEMHLKVDLLC